MSALFLTIALSVLIYSMHRVISKNPATDSDNSRRRYLPDGVWVEDDK